jgi:thymidine kinase
MPYGDLTLFTGPMFANKTNGLIKEILYRTYFDSSERTAVYKADFDSRYEQGCVISHDGFKVDAAAIRSAEEIQTSDVKWVFFDEVQFFTNPNFEGDLVGKIRTLRENGASVFCAGLDMDYLGRAFEITALLMAEATRVEKLTALCSVCGGPATHTARINPASPRFVLGSDETYSPVCARHWFSDRQASCRED